jgi:hypothetical protein
MLIEAAHRRDRRPRWHAWLAPVAAALVLHGWLLGGDELRVGFASAVVEPPTAIQVRSVEAPAQQHAPVVEPLPTPRPEPAPKRVARAPVAPVPPARSAVPEPAASEAAQVAVDAEIVKPVAAAPASSADEPPPTYRTRMPPPATLRYQLRRGMFSGSGELIWKPAGDRYELRLEGSVAGLHVITETSTGSLDAHGIAPLRYTDERIRRGVVAANFQRDKGKITYSGPQDEFVLVPGAQDRVSWMIQMAAILEAAPQLAAPGGRVVMFVTGARADADTWVFRYVETDTIPSDGGMVRAVKFTREPRRPYDRMVEVWLAPAHHHLPARARLTATADGEIFELLLRDIHSP